MLDIFQGSHSTTNAAAVGHYTRALHIVLSHRPGGLAALDEALALEPGFVAAYALKGFGLVLLARPELDGAARMAAQEARRALHAAPTHVPSEAILVAALDDAVAGRLLSAADRLEAGLWDEPRNVLFLKLAHALRFMAGDAGGMLQATSWAVRSRHPDDAGSGYVMGCHAFALEEHGRFGEAEAWAESALALAPDDAWALHAVSHIDEMRGRVTKGIRRLESTRPLWSGCNNFQFHMAWHLALFHLEAGSHDEALALYDETIRREQTDDYRDVANATSLLWRLRDRGVAVGDRWDELAAIARRRAPETTLAFASLHHLLALVAKRDHEAVETLLLAWRAKAERANDDQSRSARLVAVALAEAMAGMEPEGTDYAELARRLQLLGGSNAQREVFLIALNERARAAGDATATEAIRGLRRAGRSFATTAKRPLAAVA